MLKKIIIKFWPGIIISIVIFAFFYRLFIPHLSFYTTPDYGRSDAISLSLANKFYYSQQLKENNIPIWNPDIGTGYPTLAEGQTAVFFIPNLIIFRVLPFALAYNLTLVLSLLLAGWGIYLFTRSLGISKSASMFAGIIFPLGGFFIFHVQHHNLIQTASLTPWLFWQIEEFLKSKKLKNLLIFSLILSQQFMAGFPQITFYSLIAVCLCLGLKHIFEAAKPFKVYFFITVAIILGILIAAVQIIPSYEFLQNSSKNSDPKQILEQFPYVTKNLLLFLDPFILGSPKNGTYPTWTPGKWGIFWESQGYVGILPLIFTIAITFAAIIKKLKIRSKIFIFACLLFITIMLSLGKESPMHVLYSIPPLSYFRVPSRFLLISQFSLAILAAYFVNKIKSKLIVIAIIILSVINLYTITAGYNPTEKASDFLKDPQTAAFLKTQEVENVIPIGSMSDWNNIFLKHGWENNSDYFTEARNYLDQNSNLIYGVKNAFAYESMQTKRYSTKNSILLSGTTIKNNTILISDPAKKVINSDNASHIITTKDINDPDFEKIFESQEKDITYKIFKNKNKLQKYFITGNYFMAKNIPQIVAALNSDTIDTQKGVILEEDPDQILGNTESYQISELIAKPTYQKLQVSSTEPSLLVENESYYPGWNAKIDGNKTKIFAANINSRAIVIPEGVHIVEFSYESKIITYSAALSVFALLITLVAIIKIGNYKVTT